jgi:uncharacterized membrane protein
VIALALFIVADLAAVELFGPLLALAWWAHYVESDCGFELVLVIAGAGLLLIVEFAYAQVYPHDPNAPRWNTIYKVYHQTWIIWGLAAAPIATALLNTARTTSINPHRGIVTRFTRIRYEQIASVLTIILIIVSLSFGGFVTAAKLGPQITEPNPAPLSLNGTAYVLTEHPEEASAIRWLQTREGQSTMVSQPTRTPYRWEDGIGASAGSSLSGIPTVVGWSHEAGYRGEPAFDNRARDIDQLYTGSNTTTKQLLATYNVDLIYMGPHETIAYGQRDFSALEGVTIAHQSGNVTIYHVNHTNLHPPPT